MVELTGYEDGLQAYTDVIRPLVFVELIAFPITVHKEAASGGRRLV